MKPVTIENPLFCVEIAVDPHLGQVILGVDGVEEAG